MSVGSQVEPSDETDTTLAHLVSQPEGRRRSNSVAERVVLEVAAWAAEPVSDRIATITAVERLVEAA